MTTSSSEAIVVFESAVLESFAFLEGKFGFSKSCSRPNPQALIVRYENAEMFVNVMFGPPSYEPEMGFGRRGFDDLPSSFSFGAGDLIQLETDAASSTKSMQSEPIAREVAWLASLLAESGKDCLSGKVEPFHEMKLRRDSATKRLNQDNRKLERASEANAAWIAKDYRRFVELFAEQEGAVSPVDQKRLKIAMKRLSQ